MDKVQILGTSKLLTYAGCFRPLFDSRRSLGKEFDGQSNGLETISDPGNGVSLLGKWILGIDERRPGELVLEEVVDVHCNVFLGWFVKGQMESAHVGLHKEFGRRFCEMMMEGDPFKAVEVEKKAGMTWKESEELRRRESGLTESKRVGTDEMKGVQR